MKDKIAPSAPSSERNTEIYPPAKPSRLTGVVDYIQIELKPEQSAHVARILDLDSSAVETNFIIKDFSAICATAMAALRVFDNTRPKRSYAKNRAPRQKGRPPKYYLDILAFDIAQLMRRLELSPKIIRTDEWGDAPSAKYNYLSRLH